MVKIIVQDGFWEAPPSILLSKSSSTSCITEELPKDPRKRKIPTQLSPSSTENDSTHINFNSNSNTGFKPYYVSSFEDDDYQKRVQESLMLLKQSLYAAPSVVIAHEPTNNYGNANNYKKQKGQEQMHIYVPKVICKYWMEGKCSKGNLCTFSHALSPTISPDQARSAQPCTFHRLGQCMKGAKCLYSHDLSRWPCKYFHRNGRCKDGDACRFGHVAPLDDDGRRLLDDMECEDMNNKKRNHTNNNNSRNNKKSQFKKKQHTTAFSN